MDDKHKITIEFDKSSVNAIINIDGSKEGKDDTRK